MGIGGAVPRAVVSGPNSQAAKRYRVERVLRLENRPVRRLSGLSVAALTFGIEEPLL